MTDFDLFLYNLTLNDALTYGCVFVVTVLLLGALGHLRTRR